MVGAVVVKNGAVVGEGYHAEFGGPHAEILALREAGKNARGATLYVTLEPCTHHGKTPPCTDAILAAGIRRVVFGAADPHPQASGGGEVLAEHDVDVVGGVEETEARTLNAPFFHTLEQNACYVAVKLAMTLDSKLSRTASERTRITGAAADRSVQRLRAGFDAIVVGIGTVLADDPLLTVRGRLQPRLTPVRIVLDTAARLPVSSRLVQSADQGPVWVFCGEGADPERTSDLERSGIRVFRTRSRDGEFSLDFVFERLWEGGIRTVLCEGGGRTAASLLRADRVERLYLYYAPRFLGSAGVPAFPVEAPTPATGGWHLERTRRYGDDVLLVLDRQRTQT
jgi:diaminohydroxyphosphoribosylaminopyrimidine deaminase/5-amino-6-(5-phosphoribosylamino)uracil reductase